MTSVFRESLRATISHTRHWPPQPKPDVHPSRPLVRGWLLPTLVECESRCWGRWNHWIRMMEAGKLIEQPIPKIAFDPHAAGLARKMHENALNHVPRHGSWLGWSAWTYFDFYLDWLLYAFGHPGQIELPREPDPGASDRLWQTFCVEAMLAWPADLFGDLLAANAHGRQNGFFPTPHNVVEMMCLMNFGDEDCRTKTVCDPCLGTGRMLLHASNFSYRLYGMDINQTVIKAALVNGYCFAPWLVKPFPFLEVENDGGKLVQQSKKNGNEFVQQGWLFPTATLSTAGMKIEGRKTLINAQFEPDRKAIL